MNAQVIIHDIARRAIDVAGLLGESLASIVQRILSTTYLAGSRKPWTLGYSQYKAKYLQRALSDPEIVRAFRSGLPLPSGYGYRLDARAVELPWALSRIQAVPHAVVLDAGSSFNSKAVVSSQQLSGLRLMILTLAPERRCFWKRGISYLYGDLRDLWLKAECVDTICCISTIEHVGMSNEGYAAGQSAGRGGSQEFLGAIDELKRVLRPGGRLLISFPFGRYEDHGWFQQFDSSLADSLIDRFQAAECRETVYQYAATGWQLSTRELSTKCEFFDVRESKYFNSDSSIDFPADFRAGEAAVMCIEMRK